MNYRHVYHAGNFGDVFKHAMLLPLVRAMQRKERGFLFVDTHAGTGAYDLGSERANRTREFAGGIERMWNRDDVLSPPLREYVELVARFNLSRGSAPGVLRFYPGSPRIAAFLLRPQDRLALSERQPDEFEALRTEFAGERGVAIQNIDAYSALRAYLPPPERRALVLIDPPYEDANEVVRLHAGLEAALHRFPSGVYVVWYPIKDRSAAASFHTLLQTLPLPPTLAVNLTIFAHDPADRLNGCGLIVINPPWQVAAELDAIAEALRELLAMEPGAQAGLQWLREES